MFCDKKAVIWDLDNTLYRITPEFADTLDQVMAEALVYDLGIDLPLDQCKAMVKDSYREYRDGGEIFYRDYNVSPQQLSECYHNRKPVEMIEPYVGLAEKLARIPLKQFVFTTSTRSASEKILRHIGLYDLFANNFYSVEDFGVYKKNEDSDVYKKVCEKIGYDPKECIFVDDSYSNLEFAKEAGMTTVRIYYKDNSAKDKSYIDAAYRGIEACVDDMLSCCKAA